MVDRTTGLGPLALRSPLVAASGTVGSVVEWAGVGAPEAYGAAVAKSVSGTPWPGRPAPRLAATGSGMLNGVGIQNPGIDAWLAEVGPHLSSVGVPVWGSAVGEEPEEFARVAAGLEGGGVEAIEVNLSCPNLEGDPFALDPVASARIIRAVRARTTRPIGAKLAPDSDVVAVAGAVAEAGADWVVLTNTIRAAAIDPETRRPLLSGVIGGLSGAPLRPVALRCVLQVSRALPELPIVGCGGVSRGSHVVEYLLAGAAAVGLGTVHFAEPRAGRRILGELEHFCRGHGVARVTDLIGARS